jgi:DNA-binding beta-propeller fold protein YncE
MEVATRQVSTLAGAAQSSDISKRTGFQDGPGASATFNHPEAARFSPNGMHIAVTDKHHHRVRLIEVATGVVSTLAGDGADRSADGIGTSASFKEPFGLDYTPNGFHIAVCELKGHSIRLIAMDTRAVTTLAGSGANAYANGWGLTASFSHPQGLKFLLAATTPTSEHSVENPDYWQNLQLYVADQGNRRIRVIYFRRGFPMSSDSASVGTAVGNGGFGWADGGGDPLLANVMPYNIALSPDGMEMVIAEEFGTIRHLELATHGTGHSVYGTTSSATHGKLTILAGIPGYDNIGYVNGRGVEAKFSYPHGVAWSPDGARIIIASTLNHCLR